MLGRDALRQYREQQAQRALEPGRPLSVLDQAPPDAQMPNTVLSAWDGQEWLTWPRWLETAPVIREETSEAQPVTPKDLVCVAGECGGRQIWLVKESERWLMYVGSRRLGRRRDFATPYLEHAIRTAEAGYGAPFQTCVARRAA